MVTMIATDKAPQAIGPYSQAVLCNGFIFVSGQIPIDPSTGQLCSESIAEQTKQVLANISAVLTAAGSDMSRVVKTTVYLKDLGDFEAMNQIYSELFSQHRPARATVQVSRLPKDVRIEIDAIAAI